MLSIHVVYERELFSFIFRTDTFLQPYGFRNHKIVDGFMELANIVKYGISQN